MVTSSEEILIKIVKDNTAAFESLTSAITRMEENISGAVSRMEEHINGALTRMEEKNDNLTSAINNLGIKTAVSNEKMSNSIDGLANTTHEITKKYESFSEKMTRIETLMAALVGLTAGILLTLIF